MLDGPIAVQKERQAGVPLMRKTMLKKVIAFLVVSAAMFPGITRAYELIHMENGDHVLRQDFRYQGHQYDFRLIWSVNSGLWRLVIAHKSNPEIVEVNYAYPLHLGAEMLLERFGAPCPDDLKFEEGFPNARYFCRMLITTPEGREILEEGVNEVNEVSRPSRVLLWKRPSYEIRRHHDLFYNQWKLMAAYYVEGNPDWKVDLEYRYFVNEGKWEVRLDSWGDTNEVTQPLGTVPGERLRFNAIEEAILSHHYVVDRPWGYPANRIREALRFLVESAVMLPLREEAPYSLIDRLNGLSAEDRRRFPGYEP